ncbi:uncharacterized protein [Onthophagus taurus]|uniref:uncharacterized protein isoform X1 n=1 Tax=Onthophagus taurus TaxID=166361 RepID=UPI0039BEA630
MCINGDCDHPEGMLDRDLRTTKSSLDERTTRITSVPDANKCSRLGSSKSVKRTRSCSTCSFRNLCHHLRKSFHKFKQAVTVLLCLSYVVGIPTTSSLPVTRTSRETMADQNPALKQLESIKNTAKHNAYQAREYFNNTFLTTKYPNIDLYNNNNYTFFFEHIPKDFKFPQTVMFNSAVLKGMTVNEFTQIFYDCFLRFNATMDMLKEKNEVINKLKVLLEEFEEYIAIENIEPLKMKYDESDIKLGKDESDTGERWVRDMIIYRDFAKTMEYVDKAYEYFYNLAVNAEASQ